MALATMHPEDIKGALRKRFGSVFAFEDESNLPRKSVSDFLRGRSNQRVADAIDKVLSPTANENGQSDKSDDSTGTPATHRLNAEAR